VLFRSREQVAAAVERGAVDLLRAHVGRLALDGHRRAGRRRRPGLGDAEVTDLDRPRPREQDLRTEERRVGKEGKHQGWRGVEKKKECYNKRYNFEYRIVFHNNVEYIDSKLRLFKIKTLFTDKYYSFPLAIKQNIKIYYVLCNKKEIMIIFNTPL